MVKLILFLAFMLPVYSYALVAKANINGNLVTAELTEKEVKLVFKNARALHKLVKKWEESEGK